MKLCHVCHKPCVDTYVTLTDLNLTFHDLGWNSCYDQYEGRSDENIRMDSHRDVSIRPRNESRRNTNDARLLGHDKQSLSTPVAS